MSRAPIAIGFVLLGLVGQGCGPGKGPEPWMSARAAVTWCGVAGPQRAAPAIMGVPAPMPPTGLYGRSLDPMGLDELGFERDEVACAMLEVPPPEAIEAARAGLEELDAIARRVDAEAGRAGGRCVCEIAMAVGVRELVRMCTEQPSRGDCDPTLNADAVAAAVVPLQEAIDELTLPLVHWRLAGRSDRDGWFVEQFSKLVARHPGGSTLYVRGQPIPRRDNHELVRGLLEAEDVVAVVRQDGGRALLVVREIGSELVLDHFAYPVVDGAHRPLLSAFDNTHVEQYLAALAKPQARRTPAADPGKGTLVEIDRALLEEADRLIMAAAPLAGATYEVGRETWEQPPVLVDRVTVQAPFGHQGERLQIRLELSEEGRAWAQTLTGDRLTPTLEELGLAGEGSAFTASRGLDLPFFLRGTPVNRHLVHGIHSTTEVMRKIEMDHPSTVNGSMDRWTFDLPTVRFELPEEDGAAWNGLLELIAQKPYRLETNFDAKRTMMLVDLQPR